MAKKTDIKINKKASEKEVKEAAKAMAKKAKESKKTSSGKVAKSSEKKVKKVKETTKNTTKKTTSSSKSKHLERTEFVFNFLSLVALIAICLYFGGRSLYYYSRQNVIIKEEAQTLNGYIINNDSNVVSGDADGLHHDTDGYFFKGNVDNNYVWFGNRMFRVIRVYNDNSVKLISEDLVSSFMYGEDTSYRSSNVRKWLTKIKNPNSGVYYDTLPSVETFLDKTNYSEDVMKGDKVEPSKTYASDYVTTLSIADYILVNGKNSFINNGKIFFLLGFDSEGNNLFVDEDGSIQSCDYSDGYGIRAVITLKPNTVVSGGTGIAEDPYVIEQGDNKNHVDGYVRLGNDTWKVFYDKDGVLKMYLYGYLTDNGNEVFYGYGYNNTFFDVNDPNSLAYYLNNNYLSNLSYRDIMLDVNFYTGEISDDAGYNYYNIYNYVITSKVGLLNIFDYVSNNQFDDYFHFNYRSSVGSMAYVGYSNGLLAEGEISTPKHIVPVIGIRADAIKGGEGSLDNPYVVE